jgi:hypothetical protein
MHDPGGVSSSSPLEGWWRLHADASRTATIEIRTERV